MDDKVVHISDIKNDNRLITPMQTLEDAIAAIKNGKRSPTKLAVIMLDDSDEKYQTNFYMSNMRASEMLSLLTVLVDDFAAILRGKE